jgi:hypothetical protein
MHTMSTKEDEIVVQDTGYVNVRFLMMLRDGVEIMDDIGRIIMMWNGIHIGTEGNRAAENVDRLNEAAAGQVIK